MAEHRLLVELAIVDMYGREEQFCRIPTRKTECHGMDILMSRLQLEYGKSIMLVGRELVPYRYREAKPFIKSFKVGYSGHKGSLE